MPRRGPAERTWTSAGGGRAGTTAYRARTTSTWLLAAAARRAAGPAARVHRYLPPRADGRALGAPLNSPPLLRIERAAVVSFGVPSYGCHVNGFTRKNGEVWDT